MRKKGLTLIELVVAMGILAIILTMAVMIITQFIRNQMLNTAMRSTQQNARQTIEIISKEGRQADSFSVNNAGTQLTLHYDDPNPSPDVQYDVTYAFDTVHQTITRTETATPNGGTAITVPAYNITSEDLTVQQIGSTKIFNAIAPNLVQVNFRVCDGLTHGSCNLDTTPITETIYFAAGNS